MCSCHPSLGGSGDGKAKSGVPSRGESATAIACTLYTGVQYPITGLSLLSEIEDEKCGSERWPPLSPLFGHDMFVWGVFGVIVTGPPFPGKYHVAKPCVPFNFRRTTVSYTKLSEKRTLKRSSYQGMV